MPVIVNKENAKKVSDYVRELTAEWVRTGGSGQGALVNTKARYSFQAFCMENKLLEGATYRANDIVIACPFHDDESPSCSINEYKGVYNCFSCGRHGNYINFITEYDNVINDRKVGIYQKLNELLRQDVEMQAALGFSSIYGGTEDSFRLEDGLKKFRPKLEPNFIPTNYLELIDYMMHKECSFSLLKFALSLMQSDIPVYDIYQEVFNIPVIKKSVIDLSEYMDSF